MSVYDQELVAVGKNWHKIAIFGQTISKQDLAKNHAQFHEILIGGFLWEHDTDACTDDPFYGT